MLSSLIAYAVDDALLPADRPVVHRLEAGRMVVAFRKSAPLLMIIAVIALELARVERNPE